jgi:hypothetical protein
LREKAARAAAGIVDGLARLWVENAQKRIYVSSGTYCSALAQFERRMMSQIDLTKDESVCVEPIARGTLLDIRAMRINSA